MNWTIGQHASYVRAALGSELKLNGYFMPQINVKLFASLSTYMPEGAKNGQASMDCTSDTTVASVLSSLHVPTEHCHLVFVNGVFVEPESRDEKYFVDGDTLAVWPPVAGG